MDNRRRREKGEGNNEENGDRKLEDVKEDLTRQSRGG